MRIVFSQPLLALLALLIFAMAGFSQLSTIEIESAVKDENGVVTFTKDRTRICFNLVTLKHGCSGIHFLYGNRAGENWDIFAVSGGATDQTRGVDLGALSWSDNFALPDIQPWTKLEPGQRRHITINTSGADGAHGKPGRNADGSYAPEVTLPVREGFADKPVSQQVTASIETENGLVPTDYNPFIEIRGGHIYAFRVVDIVNDHYVLVRVDSLVRGTKATLSFKKISN